MGWRDLLQTGEEVLVAPWLGGKTLRSFDRIWQIEGRLPREEGWYEFKLNGRKATLSKTVEPAHASLKNVVRGYLVGNRLIPDGVRVDGDPLKLLNFALPVHCIEPGLDRFTRVVAGQFFEDGPFVYQSQDFPLGPEDAVLDAYLDGKPTVDGVPGVVPALDAAFRLENWRRDEAEKRRREEIERLAREEAERVAREERQRIIETLGDGQGRRALAPTHFADAARAALAVGGAQYLDHRASHNPDEMVVRYRFLNQRFECVCHAHTLRIIDAGICLTSHATGEKGDTRFTLESLPAVIAEAEDEGVLVIFRHG